MISIDKFEPMHLLYFCCFDFHLEEVFPFFPVSGSTSTSPRATVTADADNHKRMSRMETLLGPVFSRLTNNVTPEFRFSDPLFSNSPMPAHLVACVNIPPYRLVYNAEPSNGKWISWEFDAHEVRLEQQRKYWTLTSDNVWVAD